jgi:fermentation-respiration switch protein FrsA (DUF1100 family)
VAEFSPSQRQSVPVRITRALGKIALFYCQLLLALMALEERLAYPRGGLYRPTPQLQFEEVWLTTADGCSLHAWFCPCPARRPSIWTDRRPVALMFHGNGGELSGRADEIETWQRVLGADVFIFDYRGFGRSDGHPTEPGLYRDSRAAYRWLTDTRKIDPRSILFIGESLGCAVAVELAQHVEYHSLVLHSPFTSLPDAAANVYPWLPVRHIMRNRFPTIERLADCRRPVFISHGVFDRLIPVEHARPLFDLIPAKKELFLLEAKDHNDPRGGDYYRAVQQFLKPIGSNQSERDRPKA